MSQRSNEALVRAFLEAGEKGDVERFDEWITADAVDHNPFPGQKPGVEGVKQLFRNLVSAFPDLHQEVVELVPEGDTVGILEVITGTHKGEFFGIPATGNRIEAIGIDWIRFSDGMMAEHWGLFDTSTAFGQLGVMPPPPGTEGWQRDTRSAPGAPDPNPDPEANKQLVRAAVEGMHDGSNSFLAIVHEDAVDHTAFPGQGPGLAGWKQRFAMMEEAFTGQAFEVHEQIASGELVGGRYTFRATHSGNLMGVMPPTGKTFEVPAMDVVRVRGGKLVEHWGLIDVPSMMVQIGMMSPPPPLAE